MKNSEIKYKTSTDYRKLYNLLKDGNMIVGFISLDIDGKISKEYSKLIPMYYDKQFSKFDIGFSLFEIDFNDIDFIKICEEYNLRYFPL